MKIEELTDSITLAELETSNGNYDKAERIIDEIISKVSVGGAEKEIEKQKIHVRALLIVATTSYNLGNFERMLSIANQALDRAERYSLHEIKPKIWNIIGTAYVKIGTYTEAFHYWAKALALYEERKEKSGVAIVTGNMGAVYMNLGSYGKSLDYYNKALAAHEELGETSGIARVLGNIGNVYNSLGSFDKALEYMSKALFAHEELGEKAAAALVTGNIGLVYDSLGSYNKALEYMTKALRAHEELGEKAVVAGVTANIGGVYFSLGIYDKALEYLEISLSTYQELGEKSGIARVMGNIGNVYQVLSFYDMSLEYYTTALLTHEELGEKAMIARITGNIGSLFANNEYKNYNADTAEYYLRKAITLSTEIGAKALLVDFYKAMADVFRQEKRWQESDENFRTFYALEQEVRSENAKNTAEIEHQKRHEAERERSLAVERAEANATKKLLHNTLPPNIANRLLEGEKIADTHEHVSVLFVDIVGFTKMSTQIPASELIDLLDIVFRRFDTICKKYGLEKIKTIGDAYMAVCGAPIAYENHAERAALAALEMLEDFSLERRFTVPIDLGFRIGLHAGSVVAGIIGENKYSYDLWGDAVNTASRMESHGEEDKIHVSEEFLEKLIVVRKELCTDNGERVMAETDDGSSLSNNRSPLAGKHSPLTGDNVPFTIIPRGEMEIKGKGKMHTYFLTRSTN
ncbi:MAG: adenylate/guanylate cyclase domain-containing protein [Candidatus Kapaibacterium sp.]